MLLDERIEAAASAWEGIEGARWRAMELFEGIAAAAASKREEKGIVERIASRTGRGAAVVRLWIRAVRTVPEDLRHPFLPLSTCLWVAQNLAPEEARHWLARCHDEGLSLRRLQQELGRAEDAPTVPTLRRILRAIARDASDAPLADDQAAAAETMVRAAIVPYDAAKPPTDMAGG